MNSLSVFFKKYQLIINPLLAISSGVLLAVSFPDYNMPFLIWFALVPIFLAIFTSNYKWSAIYSLITGIIFYTLLIFWARKFHHIWAVPFISFFSTVPLILPALLLIKFVFQKYEKLALLLAPGIWIVFEFLKTIGFLKFSFGIIGYSLYSYIRFIQFSNITGVLGVSYIIVMVNISIVYFLKKIFINKFITLFFL